LLKGEFRQSIRRGGKALRFLFSQDNYWCFDKILELEEKNGIKTMFNFYGGKPGNSRNIKEQILDPAYNVHSPALKKQIKKMHINGWGIGLHQSFDAWKDKDRMKSEKKNLEKALGDAVTTCRQHWLRFSFNDTWKVQQDIGFKQDTTLGFNDRPGFRNASAVNYFPWDKKSDKPMQIEVIPMMLMDSHIYDYAHIDEKNIFNEIDKWIDEVKTVCGQISVVWHQRVMSDDYGWRNGFEYLIKTHKMSNYSS
jgi:peptidoglycan/xylan/chitin deacetylase (PgdA/CDA1 family)